MMFIIWGYTLYFTWIDIFYWMITGFAIYGVWLNAEMDRRCFYIWMVTNTIFLIETFILGAFNMSFLFGIYLILAIKGMRNKQWQKV